MGGVALDVGQQEPPVAAHAMEGQGALVEEPKEELPGHPQVLGGLAGSD
jgi:hypothetical protein